MLQLYDVTHSLTAGLDQLRVVASSTSNDLGSTNRQANVFFHLLQPCSSWTKAGTATVNRSQCGLLREAHTGTPPAADWKRPPARPRKTWLQQVEEDILLVLPRSQAKIIRCGGRYDPQLVKRSSEWVTGIILQLFYWTLVTSRCICKF